MKKQLWLMLIAVEVLILFAMLLADFGVIHASVAPLSPKSVILHITTVVIIFACIEKRLMPEICRSDI
jgi:hypothetical protein